MGFNLKFHAIAQPWFYGIETKTERFNGIEHPYQILGRKKRQRFYINIRP